jgi:hypothetical protein
MTYPTSLVATELAAVNQILGAVGQAPVTTLDETNPDVAIAFSTLNDVSREVQGEGWNFNKELEYPFAPNNDGEVLVPENALAIDLSDVPQNRGIDSVVRSGKLYDKTNHRFNWPDFNPVLCDVTWGFDFVDIPQAIREFIVARASTNACIKMVGDGDLYQMLTQREALSRASALEFDCNEGDYSIFGFPNGMNFYTSYQPYRTLAR